MKKGFSLVELVVTVSILSVILLIVVPALNESLFNASNKLYDFQIESIKDAAYDWAMLNVKLLPDEDNTKIIITLKDLKDSNLIDLNLTDPRTETLFDNDTTITILYENKQYYMIVDGKSDNDYTTDSLAPTLKMNGDMIVNVSIGSEYEELGATAVDSNNTNVDVKIEYKNGSLVVSEIDTSVSGTYSVIYSASVIVDDEIYTAYSIRTVIVK